MTISNISNYSASHAQVTLAPSVHFTEVLPLKKSSKLSLASTHPSISISFLISPKLLKICLKMKKDGSRSLKIGSPAMIVEKVLRES